MLEKPNIRFLRLVTLYLFVIWGLPLFGQKKSSIPAELVVKKIVVPSQKIQAPLIKKLAAPIITKAGPPQIVSLTSPKKKLGEIPTEQLLISKTIRIGLDGSVQPLITPLVGQQKLAGIPDKVAAQKPFKKNTGSTNLLTYDLTNGIRGLTVGRQYQDRNNNLWTTSIYSGAYKFDGKYFHYFTEAEGLSTNSVRTMAITQDDELWFGTLNGVTKYDGKYTTAYTPKNGILSNCALHVEAGTHNTIWIGTCEGPQMIDKTQNVLYSFPNIPEFKKRVYDLKIDSKGNVWIAFTPNKLAILVPEKSGTTYSFKAYLLDTASFGLGLYFFEEKAGGIWLGTKEGLFRFAPFDATKSNVVYQNYDRNKQIANQQIIRITEDKNQNIYVSAFEGGIFILERNDQQEVINYKRLTAPKDIPTTFVSNLFKDNKDNIWIGSDGLSIIKNSPFQIFDPIKSPNCIVEDRQKNIWIGSNDGLYRINPKTPQKIFKYTTEEGLPHNSIRDIKIDQIGNIWMATTKKGIIKFDYASQQFINYTETTGIPSNYVTKLSVGAQNKIWFTTFRNRLCGRLYVP